MLAAPESTRMERDARLLGFVRGMWQGPSDPAIETLAGDASTRRYHRVRGSGTPSASAVVMDLPVDARGTGSEQDFPFLNVGRYLAAGGLPVPEVFRVDLNEGLIALEDLGDQTFEQAVKSADRAGRRRLYERALDLILDLQRLGRDQPDPTCVAFGRRFDFKLLRWELDHFREWLLEVDRGAKPTPEEMATVSDGFDWLATSLAASPEVLVHRDFQSRNLMVLPPPHPGGEPPLRLLDFQDALLGSAAYDLVALLRDSYVELDAAEVQELVARFASRGGINNLPEFRTLFHMQTAQRKLKDAGRFVFIDRVRGNPSFLRWIPTSLRYARDAMAAVPQLAAAHEVLGRYVPELR